MGSDEGGPRAPGRRAAEDAHGERPASDRSAARATAPSGVVAGRGAEPVRRPTRGSRGDRSAGAPRDAACAPHLFARTAHLPAQAPRPSAPARRTAVAVLLLVLVLLGLGPGARVAGAAAEPATVAAALERSPVFIDPALDGVISPTAATRIERAIRRSGRDVFVVLVQLEPDDRFGGSGGKFLAAVRSRVPRDGVFAVGESGGYLNVEAYENGLRDRDDTLQDVATLANFADRDGRRTLLQRVERFIALLQEAPATIAARTKAYEEQSARDSARRKRDASSSGSPFRRDDADEGSGGSLLLALLAIVAAVGVGVVLARRRRRGAYAVDGPLPVVPERVFEHARAARRAELREDAEGELLALATLLDEQPVPDAERAQDAYQRALDAYAAARRCAADDAPTRDLVGILVLVDLARGDLARAAAIDAGQRPPAWTPLCAFHPLHGRAAKTVRWRRGLTVPACAACAAAVKRGRDPDALRDGDRPYFETDTVWARTGYGAFADDLVERVSRGER